MTVLVIAAFAGAVALGLLAIGPFVMTALLGDKGFHYGRVGLAVVGARDGASPDRGHAQPGRAGPGPRAMRRGRLAAAAALFVVFVITPAIASEVTRVEVSYFTAALVLCGLLTVVYRRGPAPAR